MNPRRFPFVGQNCHFSTQHIEDLQGDKFEIRDSKFEIGYGIEGIRRILTEPKIRCGYTIVHRLLNRIRLWQIQTLDGIRKDQDHATRPNEV